MTTSREIQYIPQSRAEHLIAIGRMVLSAFFLLAIWLDPTEPSRYARLTYGILASYVAYSIVLGALTLHRYFTRRSVQIASHIVDMAVFALLMFFTEGPTSPFFVYFVFLLVCATLRWQRRGTIWTAIAALTIVSVLAWYPANLLYDQKFELNRFIIRLVYLAVVATLLGYLGAHEQSMRNVLARLAAWPRSVPIGLSELMQEFLSYCADILAAERMLFIWEEEDEPWLHVASWSRKEYCYTREPPGTLGDVVAEPLAGTSFLCQDLLQSRPTVIRNYSTTLHEWRGVPLSQELRERFDIKAILALRVQGGKQEGYLLALDKSDMTADDLILGELLAREAATRLAQFFIQDRLRHTVVLDERLRLARDLHDGLLQSLTGAALQLETAQRLMETEPEIARERIREIQHQIASEQRDLRSHIGELKPYLPGRPQIDFVLPSRLDKLAERIRQQWDLTVETSIIPSEPRVSREMSREIYFVVHEALINAARHAGASALRADILCEAERVHIAVSDNGHGFSFRGRFDLDRLSEMKRGPATLRERISALGGTLSLDSRENGARLEITLPLTDCGV